MTVTVKVYDPTNVTELATLTRSHGRTWRDRFSDPGAARLLLQNTDSDRSFCAYGRVLRFLIDGTPRFSAIIEGRTVRRVAADEEHGQVTEFKGRGTICRWEDLVVEPEGGPASIPLDDTRRFNFASAYFDDSGWVNATQIEQGVGDPGGPRNGFPLNWPSWAMNAWWIQSQPNDVNGSVPAGDQYYRKSFTTLTGDLLRIAITADNAHELWLNGRLLEADSLDVAGGVGWAGFKTIDRWLPAGTHTFAVKVTNVAGTDPNPSGFILAAVVLANSGSEFGATVLESNNTWKALGYPAVPPGFTPRHVLAILLAEAQARGAVPELTLGGSNTLDSDGTAWPTTPDIAVRVGADGLTVIRQLCETYMDAAMVPTSMRLDVWVKGGKGGASGVTLAEGVNITDAIFEGRRPEAAAILGRWAQGYDWTEDAGLIAANGRIEAFLSAGDAESVAELGRIASGLAGRMGQAAETISLPIEPRGADVPYVNFTTGDTLTAPDEDGTPTTWRVRGFTVGEDKNGKPRYVAELEQV